MLIICKCLNVSLDFKNDEKEIHDVHIASLNLSSTEESDDFFKELLLLPEVEYDLNQSALFTAFRKISTNTKPNAGTTVLWTWASELKEMEIAQVTRQVKSLVQVKTVGIWTIECCLNCSMNCFATSSGRPTALVNAALVTNSEAISSMKSYKDYSPVFRIIVKPLVAENSSDIFELKQSSQKLHTSLTLLQQQLNQAIQEQVTKTEEKIRLFTEQQYNKLEEFRDRATKDHKALTQRLHEAQPNLGKSASNVRAVEGEKLSGENVASSTNKKVPSRRKTESFIDGFQNSEQKSRSVSNRSVNFFSRNSNTTSNSLDSEGLFVLEGMEDSVVNEPGHSEGESDTDHDDSGSHDEGIDVHRKRTSSFHMAKSLPVNVPVYSGPADDFDKDEESLNAVDIAASIKALARSIHGDAVFGDLPRPRFSTQI